MATPSSVVVDLGCKTYSFEQSLRTLTERFQPERLYGFDPLLEQEQTSHDCVLRRAAAWTDDGTLWLAEVSNGSTVCRDSNMWQETAGAHVPCFDFSAWFAEHGPAVVKMDIEGAEFPVLEKMLVDGTDRLLELLLIEWHERFIPGGGVRRERIEAQLCCPIELWP